MGSDANKNWYVGVSIKLADNFRTKKNIYMNSSKPDSADVSRFGVNTGFILRRDLNNRIQFETGLFFNNKGYKSKEYILNEYNSSPSGPYVNYYKLQDIYDFWYMDIPVKFHYRFSDERFFLSAGAGIIINVCLSANNNGSITPLTTNIPSSLYYYYNSEEKPSSGWSGTAEFAINYSFKKALISLFPFYERSFVAAGSAGVNEVFLYSYGVGINFSHRF